MHTFWIPTPFAAKYKSLLPGYLTAVAIIHHVHAWVAAAFLILKIRLYSSARPTVQKSRFNHLDLHRPAGQTDQPPAAPGQWLT
jgi:hypothetical protein